MDRKAYEWQLNYSKREMKHLFEGLKDTINRVTDDEDILDVVLELKVQTGQLYNAYILYRYLIEIEWEFPKEEVQKDEDQ